jgi:hypothetical protein
MSMLYQSNVEEQINDHFALQPEPKRSDMQTLHALLLQIVPQDKLWFDDGKNDENKVVCNPTVGYGFQVLKYANGKTREFFQIGISANTTGISVYLLGLEDKTYISKTYGKELGKASVTQYCIKFKKLEDVNIKALEAAIRYGIGVTSAK